MYPSLSFRPDGKIGIAYISCLSEEDDSERRLFYAVLDGNSWKIEVIPKLIRGEHGYSNISLRHLDDNSVVITYMVSTDLRTKSYDDVRFAIKEGNKWKIDSVAASPKVFGSRNSLSISNDGQVAISFPFRSERKFAISQMKLRS